MSDAKLNLIWIHIVSMFHFYKTSYVNLRKRTFTSVPIDRIPHDVTTLNLKVNKISELQSNVFRRYTLLKKLYLSNNIIDTISNSAFNGSTRLKYLYLENNKLTEVSFLGYISENIREINLNGNQDLQAVNFSGHELPNLAKLQLYNTGLTKMPEVISRAPNLVLLDVQNNHIQTIHDGYFGLLQNLKTLKVSNNDLADLNPFTPQISGNIEEPYVDSTNIGNFPVESFRNLIHLKKLYVQSNQITEFNVQNLSGGHRFQNLTHLDLKDNKLKFITNMSFDSLINIEYLQLSGIGITKIPQFILNMTKLTHLYLDSNAVSTVLDEFYHKLPFLKYLNLNATLYSISRYPHLVLLN